MQTNFANGILMSAPPPRSFLVTETIDLILQLGKTQSFTEASKILGISQSMASRKLSAFEDSLGITIIDRSSRPIHLTAEGRKLVESIRDYVNTIPELIDSLRTENNIRRELRLGLLESFTTGIAAELITNLNPLITHCSVLSGTSDHLLNRFQNDELDIFVTSDPGLNLQDVRRSFIYGEPSVLAYPDSLPPPTNRWNWSTLSYCGLPFIGLSTGSGGGKLFEEFLATHNISIRQKVNVDSAGVLLELINAGAGWSIVRPAGILQYKEHLPKVRVAPMPKPLLSRNVFLVSKKTFPFDLFQKIYHSLVLITRRRLAEQTIKIAPWLKDEIYTADLESGKKILFAGS